MRYAELGRYVDALARSGSDTRKLRVEQALKLSVPFACIIVALFGAPLAISTPRSGMAWGVAVCLATTFVDLLMFQLSKRSEEHTSELQSLTNLVCRLLLEKKKNKAAS